MSFEHLEITDADGIARLTLRRPDRRNALHAALFEEIGRAAAILADSNPRVLILSGAGDHFCSGMDLSMGNPLFQRLAPAVMSSDTDAIAALIDELRAPFDAIAALQGVTIAAIEGSCLGGGLELALACDIRVASNTSRLAMPETKWGMVPDVGGTVRLGRLIGKARALDLIATARTITAEEAYRLGVIERQCEPGTALQHAEEMAGQIIRNAPTAVREATSVLRGSLQDPEATKAQTQAGVQALVSKEVLEGIAAFNEKRDPRWS